MKKLKNFLVEAKKNTYANEDAKEVRVRGGGKLLSFSKGDFIYQDKYFGSNPFSGEEVVIKNEKVIWVMNYYGKTVSKISPKKVYRFLKKALMNVNIKTLFRGPEKFTEGNFQYLSKAKEDVDSFIGTEQIFHKGKQVYFCEYHGGLVK